MKHQFIKSVLVSAIAFGIAQSAFAVSDEEFDALQEQFNMLADQVEENSKGTSSTSIGGYGELHYNNLSDGNGNTKKEVDFHRFVLFVNHEFNDRIRFFSELEIEHALVGGGKATTFDPNTGLGVEQGKAVLLNWNRLIFSLT